MKFKPEFPKENDPSNLEIIACELRRLRALKEYELGVLTTSQYPGEEDEPILIIAGDLITNRHNAIPMRHQHGDTIWHEDKGSPSK